MIVVPVPPGSRWVADPRGEGRGVRVSAHADAGLLVLSVWRGEECAATVRLPPAQTAELVAAVADVLAQLPPGGEEPC